MTIWKTILNRCHTVIKFNVREREQLVMRLYRAEKRELLPINQVQLQK